MTVFQDLLTITGDKKFSEVMTTAYAVSKTESPSLTDKQHLQRAVMAVYKILKDEIAGKPELHISHFPFLPVISFIKKL